MLNDAGLVGVTVLSGIATSLIAYPLALKSKLPFLAAIIDRFLRFLPAMAVMTALEFLWPLAGNGPIFSRVATFVTNRCTKNWWRNFLFINNYVIDAIDIVSRFISFTKFILNIFSFLFSVEVHLFIRALTCNSSSSD